MTPDDRSEDAKPLTIRSALILLIAALCAVAAGVLFWLASGSGPIAVLTGAGAFGASWTFFDRMIT
jgi:hypothetical protein